MTYLTDHPEKFRLQIVDAPAEMRALDLRLCVDQAEDLAVVQAICGHFSPRIDFRLAETVAFLSENPHIAALNRGVAQKPV